MISLSPKRIDLTATLLENYASDLKYQKLKQLEFLKRLDPDDLGRRAILKIIHQIENEFAEVDKFREELDALKFDIEIVDSPPVKRKKSRQTKSEATVAVSA